jgi:pantoate--beta-alanine ligase
MGFFHEGHLSLMRRAREECDTVVTSLFVNPTQFGPTEDFNKYPRDEARDAELAESVGVDILFAPSTEEMYPSSYTTINVDGVTTRWEGASRPVHFSGVATVVCKLFNIVRPNVAYFGLKDFQQCAVIRTMVNDLKIRVDLRFIETVREASGLAMSSRNQYLSPEDRTRAALLFAKLSESSQLLRLSAPCDQTVIDKEVDRTVNELQGSGFRIDYIALVDDMTLEPLSNLDKQARLLAAVRIGNVRLIDNIAV